MSIYHKLKTDVDNSLNIARTIRNDCVGEKKQVMQVVVDLLASTRHNLRHHLDGEKCDCTRVNI